MGSETKHTCQTLLLKSMGCWLTEAVERAFLGFEALFLRLLGRLDVTSSRLRLSPMVSTDSGHASEATLIASCTLEPAGSLTSNYRTIGIGNHESHFRPNSRIYVDGFLANARAFTCAIVSSTTTFTLASGILGGVAQNRSDLNQCHVLLLDSKLFLLWPTHLGMRT